MASAFDAIVPGLASDAGLLPHVRVRPAPPGGAPRPGYLRPGAPQEAAGRDRFPLFLEAQLRELGIRLATQYASDVASLESQVKDLREGRTKSIKEAQKVPSRRTSRAPSSNTDPAPSSLPSDTEEDIRDSPRLFGVPQSVPERSEPPPPPVTQMKTLTCESFAGSELKPSPSSERPSKRDDCSESSASEFFVAAAGSERVDDARGAQGQGSKGFALREVWTSPAKGNLMDARASNQETSLPKASAVSFLECGDTDLDRNRCEECLERFMIQPSSRFYFCWELVGLLLVIRDIVVIPLQILDPLESDFTLVVNWSARLFWTLDILVSFLTGFVSSQGVVELRPAKVARQYIRTRLPMDLLIVVCDWSEVAMSGTSAGWNFLGMLRAMRLARLSRLIKNQKRILEFMIRSEGLMLVAACHVVLLLLLGMIHILACVWYGIQASADLPPRELVGTDRQALLGDLGTRYAFCFHAMLALFLGEHVVTPMNVAERIFTVLVLFFAFVVSAAFVGSLTTAMTRLQIIASQRSAQFAALSNYLSDYGISRELALRVQRNARHALNEQKRNTPESSVALLSIISEQLRAEIHFEVHSKDLVVHPFFRFYNEASGLCMRLICHSAISALLLSHGDFLFAEFEAPASPRMFFVKSGKLTYSQSLTMSEQEVDNCCWVAEASMWTNWVHHGTAQAASEIRLMELHVNGFVDIVRKYTGPLRSAAKYAGLFVETLNRVPEQELSDIGEETTALDLAMAAFHEDLPLGLGVGRRAGRRSMGGRLSVRPGGMGYDSMMFGLARTRQSIAVNRP